jgi:2,3-bisphosphoglycerate-independent phosphoglycerate mutase
MNLDVLYSELTLKTTAKLALVVLDGVGDLATREQGYLTPLEAAATPNLDALAKDAAQGRMIPVAPGITPGSGPGHLALFGYDPIACNIGRGVLEAVGIDAELGPEDVAARGNFCTVDAKGIITDRRAGRISTEKCAELCKLLDKMVIDDVLVSVYPVREHRFVVIFRGAGLVPDVTESDPSRTGVAPLDIKPISPKAKKLADIANKFVAVVKARLSEHHPANMVLLRGFSKRPDFPTMPEIYKLNPLAIAVYPMYRGLARLVGMKVAATGTTLEDEFGTLEQSYQDYDFFFLHVKWTDTAGEDGDFARKVRVLEEIDAAMPGLTALGPDVMVVAGDHSTPAVLQGHSWHPVPVLLCSEYCRPDGVTAFSEPACLAGGLGRISSTHIMPLAMANARKLTKFGA